jgi:hypothetical protein
MLSQNAAADSIARFQNGDAQAGFSQHAPCVESRNAGANDEYVIFSGCHGFERMGIVNQSFAAAFL